MQISTVLLLRQSSFCPRVASTVSKGPNDVAIRELPNAVYSYAFDQPSGNSDFALRDVRLSGGREPEAHAHLHNGSNSSLPLVAEDNGSSQCCDSDPEPSR
jgi:hypothetical protein